MIEGLLLVEDKSQGFTLMDLFPLDRRVGLVTVVVVN